MLLSTRSYMSHYLKDALFRLFFSYNEFDTIAYSVGLLLRSYKPKENINVNNQNIDYGVEPRNLQKA